MTSLAQRQTLLSLIDEAVAAGARAARACQIVGSSLRTVQRWKLTPHRGDGSLSIHPVRALPPP